MRLTNQNNIIFFVLFVLIVIMILCIFIVTLIYKYQQKRLFHNRQIEELKSTYENTLLQSQLEVQEQTFQHIAREIHDNIGQKLTLAKLYLNTLSYSDADKTRNSVNDSLDLITESISGLSDVSRSMGTEILLNNGLVKGIELEIGKLEKTGAFSCTYNLSGKEIFLNSNAELILFRIVQESINNFIKHAGGNQLIIDLNYSEEKLILSIRDNGKGFDINERAAGSGIANIKKRAAMLHGESSFSSSPYGTCITINIPINENI